jgi:shikimate 5-dehydrogenase
MEAFPGQPTVGELDRIYDFRAIDKSTRFIGVTGVGERERLLVALLNCALANLKLPLRCLPLQVGNLKLFRKVIEAVKLRGVVIEEDQQDALREVAGELDDDVRGVTLNPGGIAVEHPVDVLVQADDKQWHGANTFISGAAAALEKTLADSGKAIEGTTVMMAGLNSTARGLARSIKEKGGRFVFASRQRDVAARFCRMFGGRNVQMEAVYTTLHDVLIVNSEVDADEKPLHPGHLKAGMTVMDLTDLPHMTPLLREAEARGCAVVPPRGLLIEQVRRQVKRLTGQEVAAKLLDEKLAELVEVE